ncbi:MAG: amino acid racemase [Planctomycetota bacterium]
MSAKRLIGIVGGVGPYAGIDLAQKVFDQTKASSDQEHLPVALLSLPEEIVDRTEYLLGHVHTNPAHAIACVILQLDQLGAAVVGIPCNTAHAPAIFDVILDELAKAGSAVKVLNMIVETAAVICREHPRIRTVGVLCTTGTARSGVYADTLRKAGLEVVMPDSALQEAIHRAIYDPKTGIKAQANPVTSEAMEVLTGAIHALQQQGAEAVLLACTEIPLAVAPRSFADMLVLDPTLILARALIREINPSKLKPWGNG